MPGIAFLHTAEAHVPTFTALVERFAPNFGVKHVVDPSLLADAMAEGGVGAALGERIVGRLQEAAGSGAGLVVCTCSTIGGVAEQLGAAAGLAVQRIDRTMAERAVDLGSSILVAACVISTVGPTCELIGQVAAERGRTPEVRTLVIEAAWPLFLGGDEASYHAAIAEGLRQGLGEAEVVVLAQASMAPAASLCHGIGAEILSSPEMGVRRAIDQIQQAGGAA